MAEDWLQLSENESIIKKYGFETQENPDKEKSVVENILVITNNRVISRVVNSDSAFQEEILVRDINKLDCSYRTVRFRPDSNWAGTVCIFSALLVVLIGLLSAAIVDEWGRTFIVILGAIAIVVSILFIAVAIQKKTIERICVKLSIGRTSKNDVMLVEKMLVSKEKAFEIINEIGSIIFQIQK